MALKEDIKKQFGDEVVVSANAVVDQKQIIIPCLLYTSPSPRDRTRSRMPSSA